MNTFIKHYFCALALAFCFTFLSLRSGAAAEAELPLPPGPLTHSQVTDFLKRKNYSDSMRAYFTAILKRGAPDLGVLLDVVYPDSIAPRIIPPKQAQQLLREVRSQDYAAAKRTAWMLQQLKAESLVTALLSDPDPSVRILAKEIMEFWNKEKLSASSIASLQMDLGAAIAKMEPRIQSPRTLDLLARRLVTALSKARSTWRSRERDSNFLSNFILLALSASNQDRFSAMLMPFLNVGEKDQEDEIALAAFIVDKIGGLRSHSYMPPLVLKALASPHREIVGAAISHTSIYGDGWRAQESYRLLCAIFAGRDEGLKFRSSFYLMHDYEDKEAIAYILGQTQSADTKRAYTAIAWIGDACNSQEPITPEIVKALAPFLKSENDTLRREAADTIGTYSGEDAVRLLIGMLDDKLDIIAKEAALNLPRQPDKQMLRRHLENAVTENASPKIREHAKKLLEKLSL